LFHFQLDLRVFNLNIANKTKVSINDFNIIIEKTALENAWGMA
jgi:hypothetical protein